MVSNALKYGEGSPVDIAVSSDGSNATLVVTDQGIGIQPEHLQRIFGRFERAVSSRHYGGFGLGLYIANQIVQAMAGSINVSSNPGQGSTLKVTLPLREACSPAQAKESSATFPDCWAVGVEATPRLGPLAA